VLDCRLQIAGAMSEDLLDVTAVMKLPPEFLEEDAPTVRRPRGERLRIDGPRSVFDAAHTERRPRGHRRDLSKLIAALEDELELPTTPEAPRSRIASGRQPLVNLAQVSTEDPDPITDSLPRTLSVSKRQLTSVAHSAPALPLPNPLPAPRMARGTRAEGPDGGNRPDPSATGLVTMNQTEKVALSLLVEWLGRVLLVVGPALAGTYLLAWLGLSRETEIIVPIALSAATATFFTQGLLGRYCSLSIGASGLATFGLGRVPIAVGAWPATTFLLGAIAVSIAVGGLLLAANTVASKKK